MGPPAPSAVPPLRLSLCSLLVAVGAPFHYGYQLTLTSPSEETFVHFVNASISAHYSLASLDRKRVEAIWSTIVALFFAGAVPGSLFLRQVADRMGRKRGIVLANAAVGICCALEGAAKFLNSVEMFAVARFLLGFWTILGVGIGSVFLAECSPKHCRGVVGMSTGILIQVGTIAAAVVAIPQLWGNRSDWWQMYAVETLSQLLVAGLLTLLHESPSYLLFHRREALSRDSVKFYFGISSPAELDAVVEEIRQSLKSSVHSLGMLSVWRERGGTTRRGLRIAMVLGLCMAFSGIAVIDAYVVGILRKMGYSDLRASIANVMVMVFSLITGIASALLVDRLGRRPLMLISFAAMLCTNVCIAAMMHLLRDGQHSEWVSVSLVVAITLLISEFTFGLGSFFYFVVAETVGQSARSAAQGWAKLFHTFGRSSVLALYLPLRNWIGDASAYALLFLPVLACASLYLYLCMPETKNRNVLEVEAELAKLPRICGGQKIGDGQKKKSSSQFVEINLKEKASV